MFRIVVFCEDRKLPELLRATVGLAATAPEVHPVVNAQLKNGELKATTNGKGSERFMEYVRKRKIAEFSAKEGQAICKAVGLATSSLGAITTSLREARLLKRTGKSSQSRYTVLK
jgi:hypothetical protein